MRLICNFRNRSHSHKKRTTFHFFLLLCYSCQNMLAPLNSGWRTKFYCFLRSGYFRCYCCDMSKDTSINVIFSGTFFLTLLRGFVCTKHRLLRIELCQLVWSKDLAKIATRQKTNWRWICFTPKKKRTYKETVYLFIWLVRKELIDLRR